MFAWYQNLKITLKLRVGFALLALITVVVGMAGLWTMSLLKGRVDSAYKQDLPAVSAIKEAGISQLKAMRVLMRVVLAAGDPDEIDKQHIDLVRSLADERKQLNLCSLKLRSQEGRAQLASAQKMIPQFEKAALSIVAAAKAGDVIGFRNTITELLPVNDQIQHAFDQVSQITESQANRSQLVATATYWGSLTMMIPMVILSALVAFVMSFILSGVIAQPLARMVKVFELVAQGDLTQTLPESATNENGQVGRSLNRALAALRFTLQEVSNSSKDLKAASDNLSATATTLADGTATQSASLESTTHSLEGISENIRNNAKHTSAANQLGSSALEAAGKGDSSVSAAMMAMDDIKTSSEEISTILSAVDDLAFQSNLLAINASIEAAHAGEYGHSFAVVATEMRYLADRSKQAGKDIERLINQSLDCVNKGEKLVKESGHALGQIVASVKNLSTTVREIDIACNQQSAGVEHVAGAMTTVDTVLQTNISRTQGLSATAGRLSSMATGLNDMLSHFVFEGDAKQIVNYQEDWDSLKTLTGWFSAYFRPNNGQLKAASLVRDQAE